MPDRVDTGELDGSQLQTWEELLYDLEGGIERPRASWLYVIGALLVVLVMIALVLAYGALLVYLGSRVLNHLQAGPGIWASDRTTWQKLAAFLGPLTIWSIGFLFLLKPVFFHRSRRSETCRLDSSSNAPVFAIVDRVATLVGSPQPAAIVVDCSANASASFVGGPLGLLRGKLVLTLGIPLVLALSARELTGVIAHELGHFTQRLGMRLTYTIRSINRWFTRVVYERDALDLLLQRSLSVPSPLVIRAFLLGAQIIVWLTRAILWGFMMIGHLASFFLPRRMEYDADAYGIEIGGTEAFVSTTLALAQLDVASDEVHRNLGRQLAENRLPPDIPFAINQRLAKLSSKKKRQIGSAPSSQRTSPFDTHPAPADRMERAELRGATSLISTDRPARELFSDLEELSHRATQAFYSSLLIAALMKQRNR